MGNAFKCLIFPSSARNLGPSSVDTLTFVTSADVLNIAASISFTHGLPHQDLTHTQVEELRAGQIGVPESATHADIECDSLPDAASALDEEYVKAGQAGEVFLGSIVFVNTPRRTSAKHRATDAIHVLS